MRKEGELAQDASKYIKLFNRLEAAISHHRKAKENTGFTDEADEALWKAHDKILKDAAEVIDRYNEQIARKSGFRSWI